MKFHLHTIRAIPDRRRTAAALIGAALLFVGLSVAAPGEEKFKARLSPVPMDIAMRANIAGTGSVSSVLTGNKVSITGSFEGLVSPATVAQLHMGIATGVRGPVVFDLTASPATRGTITGSFDLNAEQAEALRKGRIYVQLSSEKAPDGNLWGWLLKQ